VRLVGCVCGPAFSVCTSLRCPPCLPQSACYHRLRLPAAAAAPPPTSTITASALPILPLPNPTRLSTHLHQSTNPPSQPAISRTIASAARIPSIAFDPDSQPATGPSLPCFAFPRSPSTRGALPASPLLSRGTRRRATPCALGNYLRTTCGTCRPREDRAPWTTDQAHNAQGKQSTSRLTSSPTIPTHASSNCLSTHSPTSLSALPAQGPAVECAQSQQSVLFLPKPNATRRCHCYYPACCCCYCFFPPHLTSLHLPFPCTD